MMDRTKCRNPKCPNGGRIAVSIFRGTGYCSDNCKKALGLDGKTHGGTAPAADWQRIS